MSTTTDLSIRPGRGLADERAASAPRGPALEWPADDVFDAGLDSFPASDPPSWSPFRIGPSRA